MTLTSPQQVCNSNHYIQIHCEQLENLWNRHVKSHPEILKTVGRKNTTIFRCDVVAANDVEYRDLPILLASFGGHVFEHVKEFYVCSGCGKVYWEGSHLAKVKLLMSQYVDIKATPERSIYEVFSKDE